MRVPSAAKNIRNAAARLLSAEPPPSVASSVVDPFALPPVDVAYDVESAERALALRGFAPSAAPGAPRFIGFDVETKPNFTKNVANVNAPALVQLANERGCVLVVVGGELAVTVVILDSFDTYCQLLNPIVIFLSHSLLNYPCLLQSLTRQQLEIDFKPPYHRREVDRCVETTDEDEGKLWREGIQESCECCLNQV